MLTTLAIIALWQLVLWITFRMRGRWLARQMGDTTWIAADGHRYRVRADGWIVRA